jgi:hypothetical protein
MGELAKALLLLGILIGSTYLGMFLQQWMREHHRNRDTLDAARLVIVILVTFAALVLGLLVTSAKADFDSDDEALRTYSTDLIDLDLALRVYGPQTAPIRALLRQYTAAAILSVWRHEPAPKGTYPTRLTPFRPGSLETKELSTLLMQVTMMVDQLPRATSFQAHQAARTQVAMQEVTRERHILIAQAIPKLSWPFLVLLMFWLAVIFVMFGLTSPRNGTIHAIILLSAVSIASAVYLIIDLDTPFTGLVAISSQPMRDALLHMDQPLQPLPQ